MSFVSATPELMTSAAADLAAIGSAIDDARAAAAVRTTSLVPAAADEVSAAITALFNQHTAKFQALQAQATVFHQRFVELMNGGAAQYLNTEAANVQQVVNGTFVAETGRPLFGAGANGYTNAQGVGTQGGAGGWLWGNGGTGGNSTAVGVRGGSGGSAAFFGNGGAGGAGASGPVNGGVGGWGGNGGRIFGNGGVGGTGGSSPQFGGWGGNGGEGGWSGQGGNGGDGGTGGVAGGAGGFGGFGGFWLFGQYIGGAPGARGAHG